MRPWEALAKHRQLIGKIAGTHDVRIVRASGSVLHGQDTEGSDLDVLIDPTPETTMLEFGTVRREPTTHLGVPVDVLTPNALPKTFRTKVLLAPYRYEQNPCQ